MVHSQTPQRTSDLKPRGLFLLHFGPLGIIVKRHIEFSVQFCQTFTELHTHCILLYLGAKYLCKRRNEASDANQASISKQLGHLCNTADVFFSVCCGETQIFVQTMPNIVTVK